MSNQKTRREIEDLRALVDSMTIARKTAKTVEPSVEKRPACRDEENAGGNVDLNDQASEANARYTTARDEQRSAVTESNGATGRAAFSASAQTAQWTFILAVTLAFLIVGRGFLVPLAVALLLWNLLNALAGAFGRIQLGRRSLPKWLAWTLSLVALLLLHALVYWILISQSEALSAAAPVYQANFDKLTVKLTALIGIERMPSTAQLMAKLDLGAMLSWLGGSVGSTLSELVLVALYVAFLLVEQRYFPGKINRLSSNEENSEKTRTLMSAISKQIQTYIWIKTVVSLLTGFVSYVVLRLIGVDFAAVWALIIFLLNYIPNIGSFVGVIFPALLTLVQFETLTPFVMVVLGLGGTQFFIGNIIEPAMMGKSLNLSSFVILLSLTFWGMTWGIAGMILCVPIMVCIAIVCAHIDELNWIAVLLSSDGETMVSPHNT